MARPINPGLMPQDCMCEDFHGPRRADGVIEECKRQAVMVGIYDAQPVPLCQECLDAKHMGPEDDENG